MRKAIVVVLMAIAAMSLAQERESVGGWTIYRHAATLLDPASTMAYLPNTSEDLPKT